VQFHGPDDEFLDWKEPHHYRATACFLILSGLKRLARMIAGFLEWFNHKMILRKGLLASALYFIRSSNLLKPAA